MIPWLEQDKLDASISVRNMPNRKFFTGSFEITWVWWGDEYIDVWFIPKYVNIFTIYQWSNAYSECNLIVDGSNLTVNTTSTDYTIEYNHYEWSWSADSVYATYIYRDSTRSRYMYVDLVWTQLKFYYWYEWAAPAANTMHIFAIW